MNAPRFLLPNTTEATTVLRRLARSGWQTREGFALPDPTWDVTDRKLLLYGRVPDMETAGLAVLAAARGAGVVVIADPDAEPGRSLLADLLRIGPVGRDADDDPEEADDDLPLTEEQRALLDRLAAGETIAAAATSEFLSLRTANRRIAQARDALGVRTTREAVLAYLRHARTD
ncbi:MAG: LuxR family transcriptional regulator [Micromonosporaceae bacterium]